MRYLSFLQQANQDDNNNVLLELEQDNTKLQNTVRIQTTDQDKNNLCRQKEKILGDKIITNDHSSFSIGRSGKFNPEKIISRKIICRNVKILFGINPLFLK